MAQFDIHRKLGKHRDAIPFVVVVQSALFDDYRRRVLVPLVKAIVGMLLVASLTVVAQILSAARARPTEALRHE
jgi:hypothetical protein